MFNKKILITGAKGQLGSDILMELEGKGYPCTGVDIADFDLTDEKAVFLNVEKIKPDVIIHCAAYVAVDKAEEDKDTCYNVNVNGTKNIVDVAKKINAELIFFSTDYVLNENGTDILTEEIKTNPINYYGYSKEVSENYIKENLTKYYILRISWIYGANGNNFIKTMIKLSETRDEISVVSDQIGSPTYTKDIAKIMYQFVNSDKYGIYHLTSENFCSWYDFAVLIFSKINIKMKVNKILSEDYKTLAKRPKNSRLSKDKLANNGFERLPLWEDALDRYLNANSK